jgi:hypothetical protein
MELVWMRVLADRLRADLGCPLSPGAVSFDAQNSPTRWRRSAPRQPASPGLTGDLPGVVARHTKEAAN